MITMRRFDSAWGTLVHIRSPHSKEKINPPKTKGKKLVAVGSKNLVNLRGLSLFFLTVSLATDGNQMLEHHFIAAVFTDCLHVYKQHVN